MKSIVHCETNSNTVEKRPTEAVYDGTSDFVDIGVPLQGHETVIVREVELWNGRLWDRYVLSAPVACSSGTTIRMRVSDGVTSVPNDPGLTFRRVTICDFREWMPMKVGMAQDQGTLDVDSPDARR